MISCMISYQIVWYHMWYHTWYFFSLSCANDIIEKSYDIIYDIIFVLWYHIWYQFFIDFLAFLAPTFYEIGYDIISISYEICYDITILWYYSWHHSRYAMIWPSDITISWYHSHMISGILWYVPLYHGTCAAGWRGTAAGWGRQGPGAPPPPASISPTCWGRVFSWTATGQRPWSRSWTCSVAATSSIRWKISGNFKLNVTPSLNLLSAALYWDIYGPVAHVGQLVVAGLQH